MLRHANRLRFCRHCCLLAGTWRTGRAYASPIELNPHTARCQQPESTRAQLQQSKDFVLVDPYADNRTASPMSAKQEQ